MIADLTVEENIALNLDIVNHDRRLIPLTIDAVLKSQTPKPAFFIPFTTLRRRASTGCLARALSIGPELILADEPTGNLDSANAWNLVKLLKEINEKQGTTILMTTHHLDFVKSLGKNVIKLSKGV